MKVQRDLSGAQLVKVLCCDRSHRVVHLEGSYIILPTDAPAHQRLSGPNHNPSTAPRHAEQHRPRREPSQGRGTSKTAGGFALTRHIGK
jgi:hypothetical protein